MTIERERKNKRKKEEKEMGKKHAIESQLEKNLFRDVRLVLVVVAKQAHNRRAKHPLSIQNTYNNKANKSNNSSNNNLPNWQQRQQSQKCKNKSKRKNETNELKPKQARPQNACRERVRAGFHGEGGKEGIATHAPAWRISHGGEVPHSVGHGGCWAQGGEVRHVYGIKWRRA